MPVEKWQIVLADRGVPILVVFIIYPKIAAWEG